MTNFQSRFASAFLVSLLAACGGSVTVAPAEDTGAADDSSTNDSTVGDSTSDSAANDTANEDSSQNDSVAVDTGIPEEGIDVRPDTGPTSCPATEPAANSACPKVGMECGYGSDPRPKCDVIATCSASGWSLSKPDSSCSTPPPSCPPKEPTGTCSALDEVCAYGNDTCTCSCGPLCGPSGGFWSCQPAAAGCPSTPPTVGATCGDNGLTCTFECGPDGARRCEDGQWRLADGGPCPVSTRTAKRDIDYLDDASRAKIAAEVEAMKLATWNYRNPALNGDRRHMGIILEDLPPGSFAADPKAQVVDLYGYTSMLVATVQTQQKEIAQLQKELAEIRAQLPKK